MMGISRQGISPDVSFFPNLKRMTCSSQVHEVIQGYLSHDWSQRTDMNLNMMLTPVTG